MIFNILGLIISILILCGGIYYLIKEKQDKESAKIYGIITAIGVVLTVFMIVKIILL